MTPQQFMWLKWLDKHGGHGRVEGYQIVAADGESTGPQAAICFLHLVAAGAVSGFREQLMLTDYGRRCLERTTTRDLL